MSEMSELKPANLRVRDAFAATGIPIEIAVHAQSTRTAEEAAAAAGCHVGQIVKSLVFRLKPSGRPVLLLVSGSNRVNEKAVARHIGENLTRPDAQYVRDITGFAIGGIPPLGHAERLATYIDQDLMTHPTVWAAAGTPESVFPIEPNALVRATSAITINVT